MGANGRHQAFQLKYDAMNNCDAIEGAMAKKGYKNESKPPSAHSKNLSPG
jgi:hypothetical protein